ncbi:luciferase family protein [Paenibacillus beijingensis]|uniref:Luciferase domain-containing protein n=1 Tax=Paenibacillus beijingensis TaxID=1126833 RepID=A0A0D5NEW0_9BACL|nr:luciferase family protein [Paenibacillus beijingensis]AJY73517.1 hypothetical protein VN24_01365 [Paenibacillus beijingensis]
MKQSKRDFLMEQLLLWPGVTVQPHRFGGDEFVLDGKEIGHLHGDHLVDLMLTKPVRDRVVEAGLASPHHIYPDSGWVSVYLKTTEDVKQAIELLRMNYERIEKSRKA